MCTHEYNRVCFRLFRVFQTGLICETIQKIPIENPVCVITLEGIKLNPRDILESRIIESCDGSRPTGGVEFGFTGAVNHRARLLEWTTGGLLFRYKAHGLN